LDKKILLFFIHSSLQPSIETGVEQLSREIKTETWMRGSCPVCGSSCLSLLEEEVENDSFSVLIADIDGELIE
jgi:predicted nucleotide-binding protein